MLFLFFAFISGLVTISAPCIWPLLPIVLSVSSTGGHKKPLGVAVGIVASFGILTLTLSYIVKILPINLDLLRLVAVVVLIILGLSLIIPKFAEILELYVSRFSGKLGGTSNRNGLWGGFLTGVTLGIVWTPCAGPVLATIAALAATTRVNFQIVLITVFYMAGVFIPLFVFSILGRRVLTKTKTFSKYTHIVQQIFGLIMILTAILIFTNEDKVLSAKLLDFFPSYTNTINNFESKSGINSLQNDSSLSLNSDLFNENSPAPDFIGITNWLNTDGKSLSLADLKGKVILVDFWTYTCINCIRTLPHITSWYSNYKDKNFVVVGVHTPEFEFEKNTTNVENAIKMFEINYPVAQDNNYATWTAFQNQYWPAEYLIDKNGNIRRVHFGEGEYDKMEQAIQILIKETGVTASSSSNMADTTPVGQRSPETYLGSNRMQYFYPNGNISKGKYNLNLSENLAANSFSYGGSWDIEDEYATPVSNATLNYNFNADKVYLVMKKGTSNKGAVKVYLDGQLIDNKQAGSDVKDGVVNIDEDRLYNLVDFKDKVENHILKLEIDSGIQVFAFTFG